jgi:hypothetical protein
LPGLRAGCENSTDPLLAFTTAAKSDVPRASAFQKSRAAIGLKANANDPVNKEKKASDNSQRVGEVGGLVSSTPWKVQL